jgi:choline dehydrogenase-like flavoprotein
MMTIGRCAVLTRPHNGRMACHYCGSCHRGCMSRAYFSSLNATLPAALATGKVTLRPYSIVHGLDYDRNTRRVTGVRVIDAQTRQTLEYRAKVIFLCASTLESARILLLSSTPQFPNGLANSSGELGHNLMDHVTGGGASGMIPGFEDKTDIGDRPNGIYIPRFRNVKTKSQFLRGYGYQGDAGRSDWERGVSLAGFGAEFKRSLKNPGPWYFSMGGFCECLPDHNNYVELDRSHTDAWGIPILKISCVYGPNERALRQDSAIAAAEMLAAAGARDIQTFVEGDIPGIAIHEMGTARMGRDPKTSVLNTYNQAHDIKNLFVSDGACMASSSCVNPSITYMALTARACHYAVEQMKRGEI